MMKHHIKLQLENTIEIGTIEERFSSLTFTMKNGFRKTYTDHDLYLCLAQIRRDFPEIKFLCKGSKLNVFPSRMCSQMGNGAIAYEMILGKAATRDHIVHIFDFEDQNIVNDISEQIEFYHQWISYFWPKQTNSENPDPA
ncbi:hypothetical protein [Pseudomonas sp. FP1740]|uniref:hypothetical protein n=1 Tax=Pseudomonas sp. FP1740 TaxID=2954078 RepID=UPI002735B490|nr:hypothetical protein [Pseudomonas sp. FP1740]WLG46751.1 hypothetical protein PSH69_09090 [Pseudomonas sp. FP1740]